VRKLLSSPGIVFKGSGWYATDHRSPSGASRAKQGSDKSGEKSSDSASSENKSSEKAETKASGGEA
jgi:hypothetical protein